MMLPFETEHDGRLYIHEDRWRQQRHEWFCQYPCPPGKWRMELQLVHPRSTFVEVPVDHNPHAWIGYDPRTCYYECADWSTIFGVHDGRQYGTITVTVPNVHEPIHMMTVPLVSHRVIVESGNAEPLWGERVTLFSTSQSVTNEPWGRTRQNKFAYFRGRYWQVKTDEFLHPFEWIMGWGRPPISGCPVRTPGVNRRWTITIPPRFNLPNVDIDSVYVRCTSRPNVYDENPKIYRHGL